MLQKDLANPFLSSRSSVSESSSLLSYGDEKYSVFNILKGNDRLYRSEVGRSQKVMEEKILWKYEKQFYEMDEFGHSMAQEALEERVCPNKPTTNDFWANLPLPTTSRLALSSGLKGFLDKLSTSSNFSASTFKKQITSRASTGTNQTDRRTNRQEAQKLRHRVQSKKLFETAVNKDQEKFSVLKMYKKQNTGEGYGTGTAITFGKIQSKQSQRRTDERKFQYPQSIYIEEDQYFFIPLG